MLSYTLLAINCKIIQWSGFVQMRSVPDLHSISGQTVKVKAVKVANFIRKVLCRPPLKLKIERLNENGQFLIFWATFHWVDCPPGAWTNTPRWTVVFAWTLTNYKPGPFPGLFFSEIHFHYLVSLHKNWLPEIYFKPENTNSLFSKNWQNLLPPENWGRNYFSFRGSNKTITPLKLPNLAKQGVESTNCHQTIAPRAHMQDFVSHSRKSWHSAPPLLHTRGVEGYDPEIVVRIYESPLQSLCTSH